MYPEARDRGFKLLTGQRKIGQMIYLKFHFGSLIQIVGIY